ncbi:MAG: hypothetical protein E7674_04315 [Ruminococcaceae bacterium]|nr:hypothetical protein [Oscillospiraceae bacterium]
MKEFFGFGGYERIPEGYFSWQHLTFVSSLMLIMVCAALFFGLRNKNKTEKQKNKVLLWAAILIDGAEIFKTIILCVRSEDPLAWLYNLPLFLCSIQLIAIPLAALSSGRLKQAALDFVFIFGVLGAVMGTYCAGQNYGAYPVLSFDNVVSGITHSISGFAALYIGFSRMISMKKKNIWITVCILLGFCVSAFIANTLVDYNYMFLRAGDGTPYDILYNLVNGNAVLYPLGVVGLFLVYIVAFYFVFYLCTKRSAHKK